MMTSTSSSDLFAQFKIMQRESWQGFAVNEGFTTPPAAELVKFAAVAKGESVLDVGCGTGVVAVTAARAGASTKGLDLTAALLERARQHALLAGVDIEFTEGDAEALPYQDASFNVVLSQFGHMFAPRPEVATAEMLRVLKPGGRIAFSTWPPEHGMGKLFALLARNTPQSAPGSPVSAPPPQWGDPNIVRKRLGDTVSGLRFERSVAVSPTLSPYHALAFFESTFGPLTNLLQNLEAQPDRVKRLRGEILGLIAEVFVDNTLRQPFLMSRAVKI